MKLHVDEEGAPLVREHVAAASVVATSLVTYVEVRAALARRRHSGDLTRGDHAHALRDFESDWERYTRIEITRGLIRSAGDLADSHRLRAYDAVHLASAMALRGSPGDTLIFASWDELLDRAAAREGFSLLRSRRG